MHKLYLLKDMFNIPLFVYIFYCTSFNILRIYNSYRYGATFASNVSMILLEHAMMVTNTFVWKLLLYGCCSFAFVSSCFVFVVVFSVLCLCLFFVWFIAFVAILLLCLFCFCIISITETQATMVSNYVFAIETIAFTLYSFSCLFQYCCFTWCSFYITGVQFTEYSS